MVWMCKKGIMNFEIRPLKDCDNFYGLISLSRDFFLEYEVNHRDFFAIDTLCDENVIDYFSSFINSDSRKVFIAISEGQIIGYITVYIKDQPPYWQIKKVGDISGLMVHKDYRNRGLGSQLLSAARGFLKDKGVQYYTVYTSVNNINAINLYKKCGMIPLHTTLLGDSNEIE